MNNQLHVAITRKVRPGCEQAFEEALLSFFAVSFTHERTIGASMIRPFPGTNERTYGIIRSFACEEDRDAFYASDDFRQFQETIAPLVEPDYSRRELHGLEAFFREGIYDNHPPRWKMALLTLLGVYPAVYLFSHLHKPFTGGWHPALAILLTSLMVVPTLAWVVMPMLTRLFRFWLIKRQM